MTEQTPTEVRIVDGPVPDDDPSHKLRLDSARDLVARAERQLERDTERDPDDEGQIAVAEQQVADAKAALALVEADSPLVKEGV